MSFDRLPFHVPFLAPEAGAGAAPEAPAPPVDPPAVTEEDVDLPEETAAKAPAKRGKKAAAAPAEPTATTEETAKPQSDLQAMAKLHAKIEALEEKLAAGALDSAKTSELVANYQKFAVAQAKKALESAPKFTQDRVQMNEADPLATIQQIELYNAVYAEAKAAAAAEQPPAAMAPGSAPPPASGAAPQKIPSVWDPVPPTKGRTRR